MTPPTPMSVLAAGLAATAVLAAVSRPAARIRAAGRSGAANVPRLGSWMRGRPDAPGPARRAMVAGAAGLAAGFGLAPLLRVGPTVGPALVGLTTIGVWVLLGRLEPVATRRRRQRLILDTPAALELLGACLAAGLPPRNATAAVVAVFEGPVAEDLGKVLAAVNLGVSDAVAWRTLRSHPQLGPAAIDLARCVESGTRMAETLAHHGRDARRQRQATLEVAAKAVGVRSVLPLMGCFIPAFLLLGIVPTLVSAISRALP